MQEPTEVIVLVGMYCAVLVPFGDSFTDPIVLEFDSVNNPTGAILQNPVGIFKVGAVGIDFSSE